MKYRTIDLCAGIGGIRKGFELTGCFENVLSAEIDPYAAQTYQLLFGEDPTNDLTSDEFKEKVSNTEYDVLLAGFPCQAFSRVGLRKGFRDATRGTIFFDIADIIQRTQPKAVFLENVEGLLYHDKGNTMERIINTLEYELRYRVIGVTLSDDGIYEYSRESFVRNTKDFRLPQNRPRAYIMAFSKDQYCKDAFKQLEAKLPLKSDKEDIFVDLNAVLETEVADKYYMAEGYLETLKKHRKRQEAKGYGFGYCVVNEDGIEKPIASTILATGGSGKERNLIRQHKDGVAGKMIGEKKTPLNSEDIRVMTPTEWGRLQGFIGYAFMEDGEDKFRFPEGMTDGQKYKQFGNSVSIPVIEEMAGYMLDCFDKLDNYQEYIILNEAAKNEYLTRRMVMETLDVYLPKAKAILEKMLKSGKLLMYQNGQKTRTRYMLPPKTPSELKFSPFNQKEAVLRFAESHDTFTNEEVIGLLGATKNSAHVLLSTMVKEGLLRRITRGVYALEEGHC